MAPAREIRRQLPLTACCSNNNDNNHNHDDVAVSSLSSLLPPQQQKQSSSLSSSLNQKNRLFGKGHNVVLSLFVFSLSSQHTTFASSPNIGGGGSNFGVHHHRRRQQILQRQKQGSVPPYYSYFRGGQASEYNNNNGDDDGDDNMYWGGGTTGGGGESTLDDDDLDEYIEFLLAAAEDKASESDNPLFKKKKMPSKKHPTTLLQTEEQEEEETIVTPIPLNEEETTENEEEEEIDDESVLLASVATVMGDADNVEEAEDDMIIPQPATMNLEEEEDDEEVATTIPQVVDIQTEEADPVLLVDDVDDVSQLDTMIESLVASVGDDDDLSEEEEEEVTVDAVSAAAEVPAFDDAEEERVVKLVEEQLLAENSETIEDIIPAAEIEEEAIVCDGADDTIQLDEVRDGKEMLADDDDDDATVEDVEDLVEVTTEGVEGPETVAAIFDVDEETVIVDVDNTIQLDGVPDTVAAEAAADVEEEETTVFDVDQTIQLDKGDGMEIVPDAVDEDLVESTTMQQIVEKEAESMQLEEDKEEQITMEDVTPLVSAALSGTDGENIVVSDEEEQEQDDVVVDDPEFFLGPSAAEDAPPIVVEATNSDNDEEESLSSSTMTASRQGETSADDDVLVAETKEVSKLLSQWNKVKGRIVKSPAYLNEKIKGFQESSTAAAKKQSKRLSETYSAFLSKSRSVLMFDKMRMKKERKSTLKEDAIPYATNSETTVESVDHDRIYQKYFGDESQHSPLDDLHSDAQKEKESDQYIPAHTLKILQSRVSTVVFGYPAEGLRTLINAGRSSGEIAGQAVHDIAIKYPSEGIRTIVDTGRNPGEGLQTLINTGRTAGKATGQAVHEVAVKYPSMGIRTVIETGRTTGETAGQALHDVTMKYPSRGIRAIVHAGRTTSASTGQGIDAFIRKQVAFFRKKRGVPESTMLSDTDTDTTLLEVDIEDVAVESDLELSSSEDEEFVVVDPGAAGEGLVDGSMAEEEDDSIMLESSSEEEAEEEQLSDTQSDEEIEIGHVDDSMDRRANYLDEEPVSKEADVFGDAVLEDTYIEEEQAADDSEFFVDEDVEFVPDEAEMPGGDFKINNAEDHDVEEEPLAGGPKETVDQVPDLGGMPIVDSDTEEIETDFEDDHFEEVAVVEDTEISEDSDEDYVAAADEDVVYEGLEEEVKETDDNVGVEVEVGSVLIEEKEDLALEYEDGSHEEKDEDDLDAEVEFDSLAIEEEEEEEEEEETDDDVGFEVEVDRIVMEEDGEDLEEDLGVEVEVDNLVIEEEGEEEETEDDLDVDVEVDNAEIGEGENKEIEDDPGVKVKESASWDVVAAASESEDSESEDVRDADQKSAFLEVAGDEYEFYSADEDVVSMADTLTGQAEGLALVDDDEVSSVDEEEESEEYDVELVDVGLQEDEEYDATEEGDLLEVEDSDLEDEALLVASNEVVDDADDDAVEDNLVAVDASDAEDIDDEDLDMSEEVELTDVESDLGTEQKVNFLYRFLLSRGLSPLVMIFVIVVEWCKVYLSPFFDDISELPGWLLRKESHDTIAFLRGGATPNSAPMKTLADKGNVTKIVDGDRDDEDLENPSEESGSGMESKADSTSALSQNAKKDMGTSRLGDIFPVSNKRPNGMYRFLLRYGYVGHVVAMEMILFREWIHTYIPMIDSMLSMIGDAIFPGSSRALRDQEDGMVSQTTGFVSSDGSAARGGKKRRSQTKKDDQKALSQMQQLGDVSTARYRFLSESFMKRHSLGDYGSDAVAEMPRTQVRRKSRENVVEEEYIEESDAGWVLDALTQEEESPVATSMDVAYGSDGASVSVGVEFNFGNSKKRKRKKRPSLSEIAMDKPADRNKVKNIGPRVSDRESGVMGRLRAAGANSLVGRSLLGAYPGDAPPPHEAASHLGLLDMAYKYGYGDLTDDEYEDDIVQPTRKSKRRGRRSSPSLSSSRRKKRRKDTSSSIGLEFEFSSGIDEDPFPSTESHSPIISSNSKIGDAPSLTSILGEVEESRSTRETPSTRKKRRRTTVRPAMEVLNEANEVSESRTDRSDRPKKTKRRHKGDSTTKKVENTGEGPKSGGPTTKIKRTRGSQTDEAGLSKKRRSRAIRPAMDVLKEAKETKKKPGEDKFNSLKKKRKRKVIRPAMTQLKDLEKSQTKDTKEEQQNGSDE